MVVITSLSLDLRMGHSWRKLSLSLIPHSRRSAGFTINLILYLFKEVCQQPMVTSGFPLF